MDEEKNMVRDVVVENMPFRYAFTLWSEVIGGFAASYVSPPGFSRDVSEMRFEPVTIERIAGKDLKLWDWAKSDPRKLLRHLTIQQFAVRDEEEVPIIKIDLVNARPIKYSPISECDSSVDGRKISMEKVVIIYEDFDIKLFGD